MSKLRIALLSTFFPYRGGIAQFNASLYRVLEKEHQVRAFNFSRQYPAFLFPGTSQFVDAADRADEIPSQRLLDAANPLSYLRTARAIADFAPDLLVSRFWMPFFAPSLGTVAGRVRRRGTRVISILDNVIPHERRPGDLALIRYFLRRNDAFIVMSRAVGADLLKIDNRAIFVHHPHPLYAHFGSRVDRAEARARLGLAPDSNVLLFFGFIRQYKGLDLAIESMAYLPDSYVLVVAGECYGDFAPYENLIRAQGLQKRVKLFVRYIEDAEVPWFFSAANACLLPYKSATQSGILQIALNFDLPAIVTDVGGLSEMVVDGVTGLVVRSLEPRLIAGRVRDYFEERREPEFARAIAAGKHRYSWQSFADSLLALYRRISVVS